MNIAKNLITLKEQLPETCTLVAVSKTKPIELLQEAYDAGQRHFGENKVQEMTAKHEALPKDIHWHMIGHLQRNKVKYLAPFIYLIHSVDSERLLREINKQAKKHDRVIHCLLQMHIAQEESKFGFDENELDDVIALIKAGEFPAVQIDGLMGMATFTDDEEKITDEFRQLRYWFEKLRKSAGADIDAHVLSMGMSNDYVLAIREGSNMIRIGSSIFGARN